MPFTEVPPWRCPYEQHLALKSFHSLPQFRARKSNVENNSVIASCPSTRYLPRLPAPPHSDSTTYCATTSTFRLPPLTLSDLLAATVLELPIGESYIAIDFTTHLHLSTVHTYPLLCYTISATLYLTFYQYGNQRESLPSLIIRRLLKSDVYPPVLLADC